MAKKKKKLFRVHVRQRMWQLGYVDVEAADDDEAWDKAISLAARGDDSVRWDRDSYDIEEGEVEGDEVVEAPHD